MRFKVGDEVILARDHPTQGSVGVAREYFGKRYRVFATFGSDGSGTYYHITMLRCPNIQYSVFDEMLDLAPARRDTGVPYRVVGPGWTDQLFADPAASVSQIVADLLGQLDQRGDGRPIVSDTDVDGNVIVSNDIVFLRL